jgi:hypothetical protein
MKRALILILLFTITSFTIEVSAQCAMCRTQLENNISAGNPGIAAGINVGILYLLVIPYLAAMVLGYMWYKTSRNGGKNISQGLTSR